MTNPMEKKDWEKSYRHEFQWGNEKQDFHVFSKDDWKKIMQMHEKFLRETIATERAELLEEVRGKVIVEAETKTNLMDIEEGHNIKALYLRQVLAILDQLGSKGV